MKGQKLAPYLEDKKQCRNAPKMYSEHSKCPFRAAVTAQKTQEVLLAKVLGGVAWMELHAVLPLELKSCAKPGFARLDLLCFLQKPRACLCFDDRNNTQALGD